MVAVTATRTNPGPPHHGTLEQTESNLAHRRAKKVCSSCCQHPAFIELASGKHCPQRSPCPSESFSGDLATKTWYVLWKSPRRPEFIVQLRHGRATSRPSGSFRYSQRMPVTLAAAAMPLHAHALRATSKETVRFMCGSLPLFCADALPKQPDVYHKSQMPQAWLVQAAVRVAARTKLPPCDNPNRRRWRTEKRFVCSAAWIYPYHGTFSHSPPATFSVPPYRTPTGICYILIRCSAPS